MRYFAVSYLWNFVLKFLDAGIKFLTIPLLLGHLGKDNYGLLTLAIATNAYLQLLDMGVNVGGVKFYSQWLAVGDYQRVNRAAQTNISFYLTIGFVNSAVLISLAIWGDGLFRLMPHEFESFRSMIMILAAFSVVSWLTFVFKQLLIADEQIVYVLQVSSVKSLIGLIVVGFTLWYDWSLIQYFWAYTITNTLIIVPYYIATKKRKLVASIKPALYWKEFVEIYKYAGAILVMSLFQFTAVNSRPLILGLFSDSGVGVLTNYRIIEVFPLFIISLGGVSTTIFLPKTSKVIQSKNRGGIEKLAYEGTLYTSILVAFLCFPVILNAKDLLTLYVGVEYVNLSRWLALWVFSVALFLHNSPVASLVLATGKTKFLVFSSAIACTFSVFINIYTVSHYGVGSSVIGYLSYIVIQMSFYYFYFNRKVLGLKSSYVFRAFVFPTALGGAVLCLVYYMDFRIDLLVINIGVKTLAWAITYSLLLVLFKMVDVSKVRRAML